VKAHPESLRAVPYPGSEAALTKRRGGELDAGEDCVGRLGLLEQRMASARETGIREKAPDHDAQLGGIEPVCIIEETGRMHLESLDARLHDELGLVAGAVQEMTQCGPDRLAVGDDLDRASLSARQCRLRPVDEAEEEVLVVVGPCGWWQKRSLRRAIRE